MVAAAVAAGLAPGQAAFAIGGSALLLPYYLGLLHTLYDTGYVVPGKTPMAGISGGALGAAATCAGLHPNFTFNYYTNAVAQHTKDIWVVRESILRGLGSNAKNGSYKACRGKIHIAISELNKSSSSMSGSTEFVVTRFRSDDDYWGAVVGSSTLSCMGYDPSDPSCAGMPYFAYRNRPVIDGAYANNLTTLCNALGLKYGTRRTKCVSVYTYEPGAFRKYTGTTSGRRHLQAAGTCASNATTTATKQAEKATRGWKLPTNCTAMVESGALPGFKDTFDVNGPWPAIFPGCDPRNPIAFTRAEWQEMALDSSKAAPNLQLMYNYGKKDAELWVQNQTEAMRGAAGSSAGGRRLARL